MMACGLRMFNTQRPTLSARWYPILVPRAIHILQGHMKPSLATCSSARTFEKDMSNHARCSALMRVTMWSCCNNCYIVVRLYFCTAVVVVVVVVAVVVLVLVLVLVLVPGVGVCVVVVLVVVVVPVAAGAAAVVVAVDAVAAPKKNGRSITSKYDVVRVVLWLLKCPQGNLYMWHEGGILYSIQYMWGESAINSLSMTEISCWWLVGLVCISPYE